MAAKIATKIFTAGLNIIIRFLKENIKHSIKDQLNQK